MGTGKWFLDRTAVKPQPLGAMQGKNMQLKYYVRNYMKSQLFSFIVIFCFLFGGCTNWPSKEKNNITKADSNANQFCSDSVNSLKKDSIKNLKTDPKALKIVYVKNKNGLKYWEKPDTTSKPLGTFDFGTKLSVIDTTINNYWLKVNSPVSRGKFLHYTYERFSGYISSTQVIDSAKADFSIIPTEGEGLLYNHIEIKENNGNLRLKFEKINVNDFKIYKSKYENKVIPDSSKITKTDQFFTLKFSNKLYKFTSTLNHIYDYVGYSKPLKSHLIWDRKDVSQIFLLDSITGESYLINEDGSNPFISKNEKQFITYSSSDFEHITYITLYKKDDLSTRFDFSKCGSYMTEKWLINELVWIDENTFALKVYDKIDFDKKGKDFVVNERYLKATIMK